MSDAVIESRAQQRLLHAEWRYVSEIMPQSQRYFGKHNAAIAAAAVLHFVVTVFGGYISHGIRPLVSDISVFHLL